MNWKSKRIDIGVIKPYSKQKIIFKYLGDLKIEAYTVSCGCTKPKFDEDKNLLTVFYKPKSIPVHLRHLGQQKVIKKITVHYINNTSEVLTIIATIKN